MHLHALPSKFPILASIERLASRPTMFYAKLYYDAEIYE